MTNETLARPAPATHFIKFDDEDQPYLEAYRCDACGAGFTESRIACGRCGARGDFTRFRVGDTGRLYTFTVVHRSYPGIAVPFVSVIVDMDDGIVLKGNLLNVDPDPAAIATGMPVRLVFGDANGLKTKEGVPYVGYFFTPSGAEA